MPMYFKLALGNVKKSIRDYAIYFLTLVLGVCVFYAFNSITQQSTVLQMSESQSNMIDLLSTLIGGVSVFIAVILGFLIIYASRYLIRRRKKEFGTYLLLGMTKGSVSKIIVLESLSVGIISLVVGLFAGVLLSQGLLYVTAALFDVKMDMFTFIFSGTALIKTAIYFGIMFLIALIFNVVAVSKYKLIDLLNADKMNEDIKLRRPLLSVIIFIVSLILIGIAYYLLIDNGMTEFDEQFLLSTLSVCIGTLLFFYALSGFLLRAVQVNKRLYLRGLTMFTLRQLNSKINTAFLSITIVCLTLFLAITSTCGGFAISTAFTSSLEEATPYDASFVVYYDDGDSEDTEKETDLGALAAADDYDMEAALQRDVADYDTYVKDAEQVTFYDSDVTYGALMAVTDYSLSSSVDTDSVADTTLTMVTLSDLNAQRALQGKEPVTLADDEYMIWCDYLGLQEFYQAYIDQNDTLVTQGVTLHPASDALDNTAAETSTFLMNTGTLVVPDTLVFDKSALYSATLNVMYNGSRETVDTQFREVVSAAYDDNETYGEVPGWPFTRFMTAIEVYEQSIGLTTIISYLALYIGFVLLIACAAILALQQLTEAADNIARYALLEKIGTEQKMVDRALCIQIGIYFAFPLIVGLCHAFVALNVVTDVVAQFGHLEIAQPLAITVLLFVVVYGGYFLITYFASRNMIRPRRGGG